MVHGAVAACCLGWSAVRWAQTVGHYRLGLTIGKGHFGKVKVAEHTGTSQKVAIKIVGKGQMDRQKLKQEIEIQRLLDHQNVVRLHEVMEVGSCTFIVMEFAPGGDLLDYLEARSRLSEGEAQRLFRQIVAGVAHCHGRMVAHRDLKPENLLLDDNLNIKIADFGLSAVFREGELLKESCGSPNYAAPELWYSNVVYEGPEVDVWSCGVILYALLCHSLPFDAPDMRDLLRMILGARYWLPSHVSSDAGELIGFMLTVNRMARISVPQIQAHRWLAEDASAPPQDPQVAAPEAMPEAPAGGRHTEGALKGREVSRLDLCVRDRESGRVLGKEEAGAGMQVKRDRGVASRRINLAKCRQKEGPRRIDASQQIRHKSLMPPGQVNSVMEYLHLFRLLSS
mmetsp:Transcript_138109/g.385315  ORF Transcript_138109/g.385315 Transcript_138109/m.385315 type:complete len:397 (-) Transcript_138109:29-1219(-)